MNNVLIRDKSQPCLYVFFIPQVIHIMAVMRMNGQQKSPNMQNRPRSSVLPGTCTLINIVDVHSYLVVNGPAVLTATILYNSITIIIHYN